MTSRQLQQSSTGSSRFKDKRKLFKSDQVYTLTRIHMVDNSDTGDREICYIFNDGGVDRVTVTFLTVADAEEFISELREEQVPENTFYESRTD